MKKILGIMLAFVMAVAITACGAGETKPTESIPPEEKIVATIQAKDCFYNAGFVEFIAGAEETAEYTFKSENSDTVQWSVYILDEAFDDGFRYIKQVTEPVLVGDGIVSVAAGQYAYVYCSANEFTADTANETATLNVTTK